MNLNEILAPIFGDWDQDHLRPIVRRLARHLGCQARFLDLRERPGPNAKSAADLVLKEIDVAGADLVVLSFHVNEDRGVSLARQTQDLIVRSRVPALLVPDNTPTDAEWSSLTVPMSGELRSNRALQLALQFANRLDIPADIFHVTRPLSPESASTIDSAVDEPYYELPQMIDEFLAEALPFVGPDEKRQIRSFTLCRGDVEPELLNQVRRHPGSIIAVEWKGRLTAGHARVLKTLLQEAPVPILLIKPQGAAGARARQSVPPTRSVTSEPTPGPT